MSGCDLRVVEWTSHAVERVRQRFGFDDSIKIPNKQIIERGLSITPGCRYRVRYGGVCYVCHRLSTRVLVITVYRARRRN